MRSCVLCVRGNTLIFCSVLLSELYINFNLGLLQTKQLTTGDQWKNGQAVLENHVYDSIYFFPPAVFASVNELCPRSTGILHLSSKGLYFRQQYKTTAFTLAVKTYK